MFKKSILISLIVVSALSASAAEEWRKNITMLAVPRDAQVLQIAQDITRRYPVLLVCYQQTADKLSIHAWNGKNWVGVAEENYIDGTFFTYRPKHAVIIESTEAPAPEVLTPNGAWCQAGNRLKSTDPRIVLHLLGRYFDFPYRYWVQFAKRYNYSVEEINPALLNIHWFHWKGEDVFPKRASRNFTADMQYWSYIDIDQPVPIESVLTDEKPQELPPAEIPAEEPVVEKVDAPEPDLQEENVEEIDEEPETSVDPFSTNSIPAAEIVLPPASE